MKNPLLVPEAQEFIEQYKEEIAQEFGVFYSVGQMDAISKDMTSKLIAKQKGEKDSK